MDDTLLTISQSLPGIQTFIGVAWNLIGFGLAGMGLFRWATAGGNRGGASHTAGAGIFMFVFGSLMLNLVGTMDALFNTVYGIGNSSPEWVLSPVAAGRDQMHIWIAVLMNILVVIGWYSAGRGLYNLATARSRQDGGYGSGIVHLAAAVALCNPQLFAYAIGATLGAGSTVSLLIPPPPT